MVITESPNVSPRRVGTLVEAGLRLRALEVFVGVCASRGSLDTACCVCKVCEDEIAALGAGAISN